MASYKVRTPTKTYWDGIVAAGNVRIIAIDEDTEEVTYVNAAGAILKADWVDTEVTDTEVLPS